MKKRIILLLGIIICSLFTSCFDLYSKQQEIDGPYIVQADPGNGYMALDYDLGNGNAIERVPNIKRAGHTDKFIIVEGQNGFYFIDKKKDHKYLNGYEIIGEPKSYPYFIRWIDSVGIGVENFKFDYYLEK